MIKAHPTSAQLIYRDSQELHTAKSLLVWLAANDSRWKSPDDAKDFKDRMKPYEIKRSNAPGDIDSKNSVDPVFTRSWQQNELTVMERMASASRRLVDPRQCARHVIESHKKVDESSDESVGLSAVQEAMMLATKSRPRT